MTKFLWNFLSSANHKIVMRDFREQPIQFRCRYQPIWEMPILVALLIYYEMGWATTFNKKLKIFKNFLEKWRKSDNIELDVNQYEVTICILFLKKYLNCISIEKTTTTSILVSVSVLTDMKNIFVFYLYRPI